MTATSMIDRRLPHQIFNNLSYRKLRDPMLSNKWLHEVLCLGDKILVGVIWEDRFEDSCDSPQR
jgi:hypothetical protein